MFSVCHGFAIFFSKFTAVLVVGWVFEHTDFNDSIFGACHANFKYMYIHVPVFVDAVCLFTQVVVSAVLETQLRDESVQ